MSGSTRLFDRFRSWPAPVRALAIFVVGTLAGTAVASLAARPGPAEAEAPQDSPSAVVSPSHTDSPSPAPGPSASPSASPLEESQEPDRPPNATVVRVIDGDTIEMRFRGDVIDIRLIGVDTPETVHPTEPVECYGPAASAFTTRTLDGERVHLEFDVERLDRFDRTLAYVWLGDRLFNERLVREGYATVATFPPNVRYADRFLAAHATPARTGEGSGAGAPRTDRGATATGGPEEPVAGTRAAGARATPRT